MLVVVPISRNNNTIAYTGMSLVHCSTVQKKKKFLRCCPKNDYRINIRETKVVEMEKTLEYE